MDLQTLRDALASNRLPTSGSYGQMVARLLKHSAFKESPYEATVVATPSAEQECSSKAKRDFYSSERVRLSEIGFSDDALERELARRWGILKAARDVEDGDAVEEDDDVVVDDEEEADTDEVLAVADDDCTVLTEPLPPSEEASFGLVLHTLQRNEKSGQIEYVYKSMVEEAKATKTKKRKRVDAADIEATYEPAMDPVLFRTFVDIVTARIAKKLQKSDIKQLLSERFNVTTHFFRNKNELASKMSEMLCYETDDEDGM